MSEENNMSLGLDMEKEYGGGFEPLPCIDVLTTISSAEIKNTKAGDGKYVKCSFKVISDEYNGRIIFVNYNIKNNNPVAVEIGMGEMKRMMQACGITSQHPELKDLMDKKVCLKLGLSKTKNDKDEYDNVVKKYKPASEFSSVGGTTTESASETKSGGTNW